MKAVATLLVLILASCATGSDPETATTEDNATVGRGLPAVNTSCQWVPQKTCYGVTNDGNSIWPLGVGITSVQVLTRSGPDRLNHQQSTFLAFVVWNQTTVGRIFRVDTGGTEAADWRAALANITAARTFNLVDTQAGATGATAGGPGPPPHPNVDGDIVVDAPYLAVVRREATVIDDATAAFLAAKSPAID